ncbi:MAG: acyl-CoA thioesterase [Ferruginibacter sp.]
METYIKQLEVRWADLDPNFHVLHSKYYDFGAYSRMSFLIENGLTQAWMAENNIGMIAFREEAAFKKEILFGDKVTIHLQLLQLNKEVSRWTLIHHLYKNDDVLAAIITIDGAWLDTRLRKLALAPNRLKEIFLQAPKAENFNWLD